MPDRPSNQGLPDDWSHGSYPARGSFPGGGATDAYGAGMAGAQQARAAEAFGTAATAVYRSGNADSFRTATADPFGDADRFADAGLFGQGGPFGPATARGYGELAAEAATAPAGGSPAASIADPAPGEAVHARGFLSAVFDFGFTSFVTPKVIKALYMLIMIGTVVSALVFTVIVFKASTAFGIVTLVVAPLFILIVMAICRMVLEFFVLAFRAADDVRVLRERGERGL
jgi:Domain of unknown function (DUF4282)